MLKTINCLDVYANQRHVGALSRNKDHNNEAYYSFQYRDGVAFNDAISLLMPPRSEPYLSRSLHSVFESGLPEGYLRSTFIRKFGRLVNTDEMGLLFLTGHSRIGHVQCVETGSNPSSVTSPVKLPETLSNDDLTQYIEQIMFDYAEQSGVSGTMPKVMGSLHGRITTTAHDSIIKLDANDLPYLSANEYFCLMAARKSGMTVPDCELILEGRGVAIKRFDLLENNARMGFEDACSLFGLESEQKYSRSTDDLISRMKQIIGTDSAAEELYRAWVFSHITRNGDAHLKNYGVLFRGYEEIQLAPIYDLVTTTAFDRFKEDIPALSSRNSLKWANYDDMIRVSESSSLRISKKRADDIIQSMSDALSSTALSVIDFMTETPSAQPVLTSMLNEWKKAADMAQLDVPELKEFASDHHQHCCND